MHSEYGYIKPLQKKKFFIEFRMKNNTWKGGTKNGKSNKKKNVKNLYHTAKIAIFMVYIFIYKTKYILIAAQHISCTLACAYNLHIHLVRLKGFFHVVFVGVFSCFCIFFLVCRPLPGWLYMTSKWLNY